MIAFEAVSKRYGDASYAVENFDLEVDEGELCVLVGPSGGGKTTILRMVNRMVEPSSGQILVNGRDVAKVDRVELRRQTGYVIQQAGLFPHLKVADNVASVPRLLGWDRPAPGRESTRCWTWWASARRSLPTVTPTSCRAGRRNGSAWLVPWPGTHQSCSWTSPSVP